MDPLMQIREVHQLVAAIDDSFINGDVATHSISVRRNDSGEVMVEANRAGLVHLASSLLRLALSPVAGSHYHLDEAGMADAAEVPLVFCYRPADWDSE